MKRASRRIPVFIAAAAVLTIAGCTFAVHGKDNFKSQAQKFEGEFPANYQRIFKCFTDRVVNTGYQQVLPDIGFAEWSSTPGGTYILLAEFTELEEQKTHVALWGLNGGDPSVRPDRYWPIIEWCGNNTG